MQVTMSKSSEVLHNLLVNAFETIEGVPKELITDNMKTVMTQPRTEYSSDKSIVDLSNSLMILDLRYDHVSLVDQEQKGKSSLL